MKSATSGSVARGQLGAAARPRPARSSTMAPGCGWRDVGAAEVDPLAQRERQRVPRIERHDALVPCTVGIYELADRQGIEELVGDDDRRPLRHIADQRRASVTDGLSAGDRCQASACCASRAGAGADLDQMDRRGLEEPRHPARGAQRIAHQRAAAGAQLDEAQRRRAAELLPRHGAPQADQLAEDLADLGRGNEIAGRADGVAPRASSHARDRRGRPACTRRPAAGPSRRMRSRRLQQKRSVAVVCLSGEALLVAGLRCPAVRIM